MKRDMDLVRLILLDIEGVEEVDLSEYSEDEINRHIYLLVQSGFVDGEANITRTTGGSPIYTHQVNGLTWEGHDFLDAARNKSIWKDVTKKFAEKGIGLTISVLQAALIAEMKNQLGYS